MRRPTSEKLFAPLIAYVRKRLVDLSAGDEDLLWALRRKLFKELTYDERGKPMHRRKLKELKRAEQDNKCALCSASLPAKYAVLDRVDDSWVHTGEHPVAVSIMRHEDSDLLGARRGRILARPQLAAIR